MLRPRRRRAGHSRRQRHGRRYGDARSARSLHLSAQVSPWRSGPDESPFIRSGEASYACTYTPRNTKVCPGGDRPLNSGVRVKS
ncbi:hypothetical protein FNV62_32360 [Streptomyces sp. RLB3-17]|nr:hypothetical protein FNV67_34555 [Streptomyces sp. S1D4-20]QDN73882.1 hypothetical protein FNV66_33570 [Streptomyces sp. S1D4-14]QDN83950.1 hypothetical protein FNV64_35070 [Streptomyces sp. S1A1-7]QDN94274.1 hypothetical protein FNV61_33300 [Streptomyces sp. RLB3-6]QDO04582.1 hypothetical protein FNV58_34625 [Streptomyces sp. RLB1-9]QDO14689.1 hypothetical protein FNV68_34470 [Streptomyces sp. S1D4-23]QDO26370.1 hypothetical protein FNV65_33195 [Streptomyces sp. S1A1-8]QDO36481.1 hypothe